MLGAYEFGSRRVLRSTDSRPANVPDYAGTSHIHVGRDHQLSDKTTGQSFSADGGCPQGEVHGCTE